MYSNSTIYWKFIPVYWKIQYTGMNFFLNFSELLPWFYLFITINRITGIPPRTSTKHIKRFSISLLLTITLIRRSKVSSFVNFYNTDRLLKRNTETCTELSQFPVITGKIEHARTVCTRPSLFLGGAWVRS